MKIVTQSTATPVTPQTAERKSRMFGWLKRIALWLIIGIVALAATGATYQAIATALDKRAFPAPGEMIDIGGYSLHLYCGGQNEDGRPTVILESGLGGTL